MKMNIDEKIEKYLTESVDDLIKGFKDMDDLGFGALSDILDDITSNRRDFEEIDKSTTRFEKQGYFTKEQADAAIALCKKLAPKMKSDMLKDMFKINIKAIPNFVKITEIDKQ